MRPKYYDDFFSEMSTFTFERPSSVMTNAYDDRLISLRLDIENTGNDTITQIDVYQTDYASVYLEGKLKINILN